MAKHQLKTNGLLTWFCVVLKHTISMLGCVYAFLGCPFFFIFVLLVSHLDLSN